MTLYIAGPMTGMPDHGLPAFARAAEDLAGAGYEVINPGEPGVDPDKTWADYMRRDLAWLLTCSAVATLPGWENSRGARLEVHVAEALEMPVRPVKEWIADGR